MITIKVLWMIRLEAGFIAIDGN